MKENPITDQLADAVRFGNTNTGSTKMMYCLDTTASSLHYQNATHAFISFVSTELPKRVAKATFGLHVCGDLEWAPDSYVNLGEDLAQADLQNLLELIRYEGGFDSDETQIEFCQRVARTTNWHGSAVDSNTSESITEFKSLARCAIILFTDSGSKLAFDGSTAAQVGTQIGKLGIKVVVIAPTDANVHDLAAYSGGLSIPLSKTPSDADLARVRDVLLKTLALIGQGSADINFPAPSHGANGTVQIS